MIISSLCLLSSIACSKNNIDIKEQQETKDITETLPHDTISEEDERKIDLVGFKEDDVIPIWILVYN